MATTLSFRFPLGRFHATRWDGGANTSEVEWPPAPWRVLRALCAVWHARWPDLPHETVESIVGHLGTPTGYSTPQIRAGSSRHYMPDLAHREGATGGTDQVIDAFLAVDPDDELLVQWPADLDDTQRETLAKLAELMPYLGRSESICEAKLLAESPEPDESWWRLGTVGDDVETTRLLTPNGRPSLAELEATTIAVRKARRLIPAGSRWVSYGRVRQLPPPASVDNADERSSTTCLRFDLDGAVPVRARSAILAAEAMHGLITRRLDEAGLPSGEIVGRADEGPRQGRHDHVHVFVLPSDGQPRTYRANTPIGTVVAFAAGGYRPSQLAALQRALGGSRLYYGKQNGREHIPTQRLLFAGAGTAEQVLPELAVRERRVWVSAMPYLPVRHRKRESDEDFLRADVAKECEYRGLPVPTDVTRLTGADLVGEAAQFRRYRGRESASSRRRGVYLRVEFAEPQDGPIALGQLSHFGFGTFAPA